eukprot:COSAG04_NODE_5927_length_1454_cov_0.923247_1_plen_72_part_10
MLAASSLHDLKDRERFPADKLPSWSHADLNALEFPGYWVDGWVLPDSPQRMEAGAEPCERGHRLFSEELVQA